MSTAAVPAAAAGNGRWRRIGVRGVRTVGAGFLVAVCIWALSPHQAFGITLVYSQCISLSCWLFIDVGRELVASRLSLLRFGESTQGTRWPGWPWMLLIVVAGGILGYALGIEIGNRLTGIDLPGPFTASSRQLISLLVFALVPAVTITYFFQSREVIAEQRAEVGRAERQIAEGRLKLLESQLEPHMLFNTLANLRALIAVDPTRAQAMLDRLIAFLRASLAGSRQASHSLSAEFGRLRDYLALMEIRMGPRLTTRFELPADLADAAIPTLLLQPLVENAIRHGLEPKRDGGRIDVAASALNGVLTVRVRDTGLGLAAAPPSTGDAASIGGFGLDHVRERLAALYGDRASFELAGASDGEGGTVAVVRLPLASR